MDGRNPNREEIFEIHDGSTCDSVVRAVSSVDDTDPRELPLLHDVVDPDSLNGLFREGAAGSVIFEYAGYTVVVRPDSEVLVRK